MFTNLLLILLGLACGVAGYSALVNVRKEIAERIETKAQALFADFVDDEIVRSNQLNDFLLSEVKSGDRLAVKLREQLNDHADDMAKIASFKEEIGRLHELVETKSHQLMEFHRLAAGQSETDEAKAIRGWQFA